jgi:ATP/maltotriose-dependent transcriptional regulator MalT
MELLERSSYLEELQIAYKKLFLGEGHSVFITGEAGIGKTSLVNTFLKEVDRESEVYVGTCDSLFTPRPLGPLYDIAAKVGPGFWALLKSEADRGIIFTRLIHELESKSAPVILVFEDIHWADEATLDLIKFLARRITRLPCLFLLTCRDNEISQETPVRNLFGEIPAATYTRFSLEPLSEQSVDMLSKKAGYSGKEVYKITGGNPFYVTEILASYSLGIPENVKDSVLSIFNKGEEEVKALWELVSILPNRIETWLLEFLDPDFLKVTDACFRAEVLISDGKFIFFKHDLYRRIIEESLPPHKWQKLNKKMLDIMLRHGNGRIEPARLVHHAKNAGDNNKVAELAPRAARHAATLGAHREAAKLYQMALQYADNLSPDSWADLYECHAYECYLTNQIEKAIDSQQEALKLWKEENAKIREGNALRFLSRLRWFNGECQEAEALALKSIAVLENGSPTGERAMAYSNLSQLKMLSEDTEAALHWGQRAIDLSKKLRDDEILAHALNNVGTVQLRNPGSKSQGVKNLQKSLALSLENSFHEHVARAYTNLGSNFVRIKDYQKGHQALAEGISFCREHDLDSWTYYMLSWKARLHLDLGEWETAVQMARDLLDHSNHPPIVRIEALLVLGKLSMRKGEKEAGKLLEEAKKLALDIDEIQRVIPVLSALLEYNWIYHSARIPSEIAKLTIAFMEKTKSSWFYSELAYWIYKCDLCPVNVEKLITPFQLEIQGDPGAAAGHWERMNCPYEQALALSSGDEDHQRKALSILDELGATAVMTRIKSKMRAEGIKNIPRGLQQRTKENPARLTARQMEVLKLLREGLQNKEIAEKLFISAKTVDHHISAILSKLDVNSRTKAVVEARKRGILK